MASDPKLPERWPTLENIGAAKADVRRMNERLAASMSFDYWEAPRFVTAAEWAVRAYPALVALVERHTARGNWNPGLKQALDELASILALAKEEKE